MKPIDNLGEHAKIVAQTLSLIQARMYKNTSLSGDELQQEVLSHLQEITNYSHLKMQEFFTFLVQKRLIVPDALPPDSKIEKDYTAFQKLILDAAAIEMSNIAKKIDEQNTDLILKPPINEKIH